jgi:hypothetical protein
MTDTNKSLTVVKNISLFATNFTGATLDPCFTKGLLETSPNILKSGSSFFIDYSSSSNSSDLKFLKQFFGNLSIGNTFAIGGGTYYIEETGEQKSFAGIYTLNGVTGNYNTYIDAIGVTFSTSITDGFYQSYNFSSPPVLTAISGVTAQYFQAKLNKEDPLNLNFLGVYGSDYGFEEFLEVSSASLNSGRLKIKSSIKLNDNSEIIYIDPSETILNENLYFVPSNINIYMRGVPDLTTLTTSKIQNGIINKLNSSGAIIDIYNNQNYYQKYCRELNDPTHTFNWYGAARINNTENLFNPYAYNGLSLSIDHYSNIKLETIRVFVGTGVEGVSTTSLATVTLVDGSNTSEVYYNSVGISTILKFDLSDSSLVSSKISPYLDYECSLPLTEYFFLNGVPGFDGCSFIYIKELSAPKVIYLKVEKKVVNILKIVIQNSAQE